MTFTGPSLITFPEADLFIAGPVVVRLDDAGAFSVVLPATDNENMNPVDWAYTVKESLTGVTGSRSFALLLPADTPEGEVDLTDGAPTDPATPNYVPVTGPPGAKGDDGRSAYDVAVSVGFIGTQADWITSLTGAKGDTGPAGATGAAGAQGPAGAAGVVQSVNGKSAPAVTLSAADTGAVPAGEKGAPSGVAQLDAAGLVPVAQIPALPAYLTTGTRGAASGVAPLDSAARLPVGNAPSAAVPNVILPTDMGFTAWAFDPALTDGTAQYCQIGYVYLIGITLRQAATLTKLAFYTAGNGGTQPNSSAFAGLYNASGTRVAVTTSLNNWFTANEGATVECGLTASYSAPAGLYWVALLINGPSTSTAGPGFARGAAAGANPAGQARASGATFVRHGRLATTGAASLPTSFTPSTAIVPDANAIWAAVI